MIRIPLSTTLFPSTTLFRSGCAAGHREEQRAAEQGALHRPGDARDDARDADPAGDIAGITWAVKRSLLRSEEHTSELQSHVNLVCRLLLAKKNDHGQLLFGA